MTITQFTRRRVLDAIPAKGAPLRELAQTSGVHISNVRMVAKLLAEEGQVFTMRAGTGEKSKAELWLFTTQTALDTFREAWLDEVASRQKARMDAKTEKRRAGRELAGRSMIAIAAERREARKRAEREQEEVRKEIAAATLKRAQTKLKKETAAAGAEVFKAGTVNAKPKKSAWEGLTAVIPDGLEAIELPCYLGNQFDTAPEEVPPLFSALRPGQYIAPASKWVEAVA